ncbi:wax ester/triacylglycerol synthase domain-containing protein [Amycolatopsis palatopharyngis]|uniref:wax ester/triacylglycerol synthase domain-containing protein n=1 Tax=Amycolatopsis palatopharyngis TaxID=187982 RepID=UPI000E26979C|nr:wax ester/triacylglycerol synthase domain-containing protein [Amycolatopsis palatopharyngis]
MSTSHQRGRGIDRATPNDLMTLASDVGFPPLQIAGVLLLETRTPLGLDTVMAALDARMSGLARFRQRLVPVAPGLGRPVWMDDPAFDIRAHVHRIRCPCPGDEEALLTTAADIATRPLPPDRPLWSAILVDGLSHERTALIVTFHHVLADGVGGLAVLAHLVDGMRGGKNMTTTADPDFPRPRPSAAQLAKDAARTRLRALAALPRAPGRIRDALAQLTPCRHPCPNSLHQAAGPRRRFVTARAGLAGVTATAHSRGATVNDAVLCAATGALHALLRHRGEQVGTLTVSIPVSSRRTGSAVHLGNQVGSVPVPLPTSGPHRLEAIARITRRHKARQRGVSSTLVAPVFRLLATLNLLSWVVNRQRLVSTSVTYLHGPHTPLSFLGAPVAGIVPVTAIRGNMTVSFVALSYSGTLLITVIADPDRCPDLPVLAEALQCELDTLVAHG